MISSFIGTIVFWIIGLFTLYLVISNAVKDGINKSVVGQQIKKDHNFKEDNKPFIKNDLDND